MISNCLFSIPKHVPKRLPLLSSMMIHDPILNNAFFSVGVPSKQFGQHDRVRLYHRLDLMDKPIRDLK